MSIEVEDKANLVQQLRETFHDMRQPVANTMALAAAALTEPDLPAVVRGRLEQIVEQAEWLADMIHTCLVAQQQEEPGDTGKPGQDLADIVHVVGEVIAAECLTWARRSVDGEESAAGADPPDCIAALWGIHGGEWENGYC